MFQRSGKKAFKKGLEGIQNLLLVLDHPQQHFKSIHIGGTNGKGSQAHLLSAVLQYLGYKVGLYTSPHLVSFRERIKVNGKMIPEAQVNTFIDTYRHYIEIQKPSFFEVTVAMAFWYFNIEKVDWAIVEVGLGGRLDSTNILNPKLSIISNISYDHCDVLGNTLAAIAFEKAGIIKNQTPVIVGKRHPETDPIFEQYANQQQAELYFSEDYFKVRTLNENYIQLIDQHRKPLTQAFESPLKGLYQKENIRNTYMAFSILKTLKHIYASQDDFRQAMHNFNNLSPIYGRWQILEKSPLTIVDVAHNEAGLYTTVENLKPLNYSKLHLVLGFSNDKNIAKLLQILPQEASYYISQAQVPRAESSENILKLAQTLNLKTQAYPTIPSAFQAAKAIASRDDCILVCGSIFVVGEVIGHLRNIAF